MITLTILLEVSSSIHKQKRLCSAVDKTVVRNVLGSRPKYMDRFDVKPHHSYLHPPQPPRAMGDLYVQPLPTNPTRAGG